jgi:hypothetical protein
MHGIFVAGFVRRLIELLFLGGFWLAAGNGKLIGVWSMPGCIGHFEHVCLPSRLPGRGRVRHVGCFGRDAMLDFRPADIHVGQVVYRKLHDKAALQPIFQNAKSALVEGFEMQFFAALGGAWDNFAEFIPGEVDDSGGKAHWPVHGDSGGLECSGSYVSVRRLHLLGVESRVTACGFLFLWLRSTEPLTKADLDFIGTRNGMVNNLLCIGCGDTKIFR